MAYGDLKEGIIQDKYPREWKKMTSGSGFEFYFCGLSSPDVSQPQL